MRGAELALGTLLPFAFTGALLDPASGLTSMRARWYGANIGRWGSVDPIALLIGDPVDLGNFHRYLYVGGNPSNTVDPLGTGILAVVMIALLVIAALIVIVLAIIPPLIQAWRNRGLRDPTQDEIECARSAYALGAERGCVPEGAAPIPFKIDETQDGYSANTDLSGVYSPRFPKPISGLISPLTRRLS